MSALADMIGGPRLSEVEIAQYRDRGYVVPSYRLPADRVAQLRRTLEALIAANPGVRPENLVNVHIEGRNPEGMRGSADFLALAMEPAILDLVGQVIGPDIVLWACSIFCKPPGDGKAIPWHQDGHYWPIRPLATCTAWVALDRSDTENGCMRVIPGSQRANVLHAHLTEERADALFTQRIEDEAFDERTAADVVLDPGQMSLHDVYLIHGSAPNRSSRRRAGVAIRYMPATSVFEHKLMAPSSATGVRVDFSTRPLWLVRGRDRSGKNDFTVGHRAG
jgi:ectoine hydroxylase-related dioxygenase (phytanoyl-CoA dioxygenase family)